MKHALTGIVVLLTALGAFAGVRLDARSGHDIQAFDVRTLGKALDAHVGQVVEVRFSFRGKEIRHLKPNWYESSIWQSDPEGRKGFTDIRVMVRKQDLKAFKSLPISPAGPDISAYGKVLKDSDANFLFVRLLGRTITTDASGRTMVSW